MSPTRTPARPRRFGGRLGLAAGLALLAAAAVARAEPPAFVPQRVRVVAAVADRAARGGIHRARLDQPVRLYAAVSGRLDGRRVVVCAAEALLLDGRPVPPARRVAPAQVAGLELRWYKVQPASRWVDNTRGGFHWHPIDYEALPASDWGDHWSWAADAHPLGERLDDHGGAGTMAFQVRLRRGRREWASPGPQARFRGGLGPRVPRVAFRRDDSYLGRLGELYNTPYIWGSAGTRPADHQAERLIGSDCADFVVYGARRLGKPLAYRASWHLPEVTRTVARSVRVDDQGRHRDADGGLLAIGPDGIHLGDLLLFRGHVGALAEDRAPLGVLDANDVMLHTYWAPPAAEPLRRTAYAESPLRVLRWK